MFDPEKVRRESLNDDGKMDGDPDGSFVLASDYDALLALYRELRAFADSHPDT